MTTLQSLAGEARIPGPHDKIFKDECFFSFDNPVSFGKSFHPCIFHNHFHRRNLMAAFTFACIPTWDLAKITWRSMLQKQDVSFSCT